MATPTPGDETFSAALDVLSHLRDRGDLLISLSPPFRVSIEIERATLGPHLADASLSEGNVREAASEASDIIRALLDDSLDDYVIYRLGETEGDERSRIEIDVRDHVEGVRAKLLDDHLMHRYTLKKTSKAPTFTAIDWDIKRKIADGSMMELKPFPYATLRFTYQKEFDDAVWSVLSGPFDSTQINFTIDEVQYLIRVLQAVESHLESDEKEGKSDG